MLAIMRQSELRKRLALGALAGFGGNLAMQAIRTADQKYMPEATAPINEDPGAYMFRKFQRRLPYKARRGMGEKTEKTASKLLSFGYGLTFALVYSAARPRSRCIVREGALLGLGTWAIGYLGWLPRTHLMPAVWKQRPQQVGLSMMEHAVYGVATVAGYRCLSRG